MIFQAEDVQEFMGEPSGTPHRGSVSSCQFWKHGQLHLADKDVVKNNDKHFKNVVAGTTETRRDWQKFFHQKSDGLSCTGHFDCMPHFASHSEPCSWVKRNEDPAKENHMTKEICDWDCMEGEKEKLAKSLKDLRPTG